MKKRYIFTIVIVILVFAFIGVFINVRDTEKTKTDDTDSAENKITTTFWVDDDSAEEAEEEIVQEEQEAVIDEAEAKMIAQSTLEGYEVIDAEQRLSTGEDYYLITMKKNDDVIRTYIDSQTGEILYQE